MSQWFTKRIYQWYGILASWFCVLYFYLLFLLWRWVHPGRYRTQYPEIWSSSASCLVLVVVCCCLRLWLGCLLTSCDLVPLGRIVFPHVQHSSISLSFLECTPLLGHQVIIWRFKSERAPLRERRYSCSKAPWGWLPLSMLSLLVMVALTVLIIHLFLVNLENLMLLICKPWKSTCIRMEWTAGCSQKWKRMCQ